MAIDVTEILVDPDLTSPFSVISSTAVIGTDGRVTITQQPACPEIGVVVPARSSLLRAGDGSRLNASIDIYTQALLTNGSKTDDVNSQPPDIIVWNGRQYTVTVVQDFSDYGVGFVHAQADLLQLNPL